jgi:hypothetical protein
METRTGAAPTVHGTGAVNRRQLLQTSRIVCSAIDGFSETT